MPRLLHTLLSTLLLLLSLTLLTRSFFLTDDLARSSNFLSPPHEVSRTLFITTGQAGLMIQQVDDFHRPSTTPLSPTHWQWSTQSPPRSVGGGSHLPHFWQRRGFSYSPTGPMTDPGATTHHILSFPLWLPPLLFFPIPLLHLRRHLQHRRTRHLHLCPTCQYDLRTTPTLCPECGHRPPTITTPAPKHSPT